MKKKKIKANFKLVMRDWAYLASENRALKKAITTAKKEYRLLHVKFFNYQNAYGPKRGIK